MQKTFLPMLGAAAAALAMLPEASGGCAHAAEPFAHVDTPSTAVADSMPTTDTAATSVDSSRGRTQLEARVTALFPFSPVTLNVGAESPIGMFSLHLTRFRSPSAVLGLTIEGGLAALFLEDYVTPPALYAMIGPMLRLGKFTFDSQVGLVLIFPVATASASYGIPLGSSVDLKLRVMGLTQLTRFEPFFTVGGGLAVH